jgi:LPS biosynthesis protein
MKKDNGCIEKKDTYIIQENSDGSVITVRELQLEILEIMDEVHRICIKNKIDYAIFAGSALGAVNYKGFIPWDDDIDMLVLRKDWLRFIEALKTDLDPKFYFQCYETDKKYNTIMGPQMKIRKRGTYIEEVNTLLKNRCKSGDGIFVDVVIYDNIAESKFKDEVARTIVKIVMPFIVLFDNLRINPIPLKSFVMWHSNRYSRKHENSKLMSQPVSVPWEKFMHEPVFLKEDIMPFKLYEFEGREYYSYNNIEKILQEWYSPRCLKKWNDETEEWEETLPVHKRAPKHTKHLNLNGENKAN